MHPTALRHARPAPQQDALALHTQAEHHIQQTPLGQWASTAPDGWAWVSVADGVASSPCADLASRSFLQVLHRASPTVAKQLPSLVRQARIDWRVQYLNRIVIAGRDSAQDSINQVGQEMTRRNMNIQPTLTERPGLPVRIIVNRDLVLRPYQPLFFNRGATK